MVKGKSLDLCKKSDLKLTKIILFILKIIHLTKEEDKNKIFQKGEDFVSLQNNKYKKLVSYYKKNWIKNK